MTNGYEEIFFFTVPQKRAISSQRHRRFEQCKAEARELRPAVEATVFQVKSPFENSKVKVRGLFRTTYVILASALATNLRRIFRYEYDRQRGKYTSKKAREAFSASFLALWGKFLAPFHRLIARSSIW